MNILFLLSLILVFASSVFALTKQFQMLQQNSYFPSRYFSWVKDSFIIPLTIECMIFCINSLLFAKKLYIVQLILGLILLVVRIISCFKTQKKSIKKLVFTSRIKRLYSADIIILILLIVLYTIFHKTLLGEICSVLIFMLSFVIPLTVLLCLCVTYPIEKAFKNYYINDAKKILKSRKDLIVIGVTGSYGKTTTKFILNRLLSEKYNVVCTPHSFNTPMGVVRTIRENLKPQTEIFICEMGAKNIGDIKEICDIVHPNYGIITSVGSQHLDTFKNIDNVFKTKFELSQEVKKNGGLVFVNGDSKEIIDRIDKKDYIIYGTNKNFDYFAFDISYGRNGSTFKVNSDELEINSKLLGLHSIINITGACAVCNKLSVSIKDVKYAAATLKATEHRLELKTYMNGSLLIDDAYNANPEGCLEAVRVLGSFDTMKKVIVTPGLIELGAKEYECNYALGLEATKFCDIIILVGENRSKPMQDAINKTDFNKENVFVVKSFKSAMEIYKNYASRQTVVLFENDLPDNYLN